ncbi:MAG: hypothetical protein ACOX63_13270 [Christensenellales bacterium]|jgi:hypothetical protein
MTCSEILEFMRHHPWNFYYVDPAPTGTNYGSGYRGIMGIRFSDKPKDDYHRRRERLDEIGSMINVVEVPSGWIGINEYNFEMLDHVMNELLKGYPDRFFVPRVHMEPPDDWMHKYPEELCVYWDGPQSAEEIRAALGTDLFDPMGWGEDKEHKLARQSFSSLIWQKDACEALRHFVDHIEQGPYAEQVIGYMPMFGNCGENMWWGDWVSQGDLRKGDFGITHKRLFYEWVVEKYGSLDALRKAWNMPELTFETFRVPTPQERWSFKSEEAFPDYWRVCQYGLPELKDLHSVLLVNDQRQVDCNEFHTIVCFDALENFGKTIKEMVDKPVGAFYGYLQDPTVGYAGHLAIDRALTTPYLDFYSSPKAYHYCLAGDPGASQAPGQSFARKKMWIEENDMRSHHAGTCYAPKTESDTITCFWRELYRALTLQQGFWWMDIGGLNDDWFTDETLVSMFKKQSKFYKKWSPIPRKSAAEVLFIEDTESCGHMTYLLGQQIGLRYKLERELRLCGTPVDHFLVDDLFDMDISQYKFIVFCHAFVMPQETWRKLQERIRPDAHILWNYAAAILDPCYNPANQKAVTGFYTAECPNRMQPKEIYRHVYWHHDRLVPQDYPLVKILPESGQEVLEVSPDKKILTARISRGKGASIFSADITLRTNLLRKLLEDAGVTCYAPSHCTVLADDKLIGFFPRYDTVVRHVFEGKWRNVITGDIVMGAQTIPIREKKFEIYEKID